MCTYIITEIVRFLEKPKRIYCLLGTLELHCDGGDDDPDDVATRTKRAKVQHPRWQNSEPEYTWPASKERQSKLKSEVFGKSPNEVFSSILDEEILTHIVMQTENYTKQNNEH